jgi:hypothetical protein
MLSRIEKASKRVFSDKESKLASDLLNDGDDLFMAASFQPGEENSSVMGNSSVIVPPEMMNFPSDSKIEGNDRSESSFTSVSSSAIDTRDDIDETDPIIQKLSLPEKIARTIPKRAQISKLTEELPWVLPGTDHVSRFANDTLDAGDDLYISESFEPNEDNSSVIGNSSVIMFESDESVEETQQKQANSAPPFSASKAKNPLLGKFSLRSKISRILPSKQYVSKLSKLAEDAPWSLPGQDKSSRRENIILDDGDDLFMSESFQPVEDTSFVVGNSSVMEPPASSFSNSKEERNNVTECTSKELASLSLNEHESWKATPIFGKQTIAGKLTRVLPSKVIRSSQKLLPWRLKSFVPSNYRSSITTEYQEIKEDTTTDSGNTFDPLLTQYNTHRVGSGRARLAREKSRVYGRRSMAQDARDIKFSLSSDSQSTRGRSLTWDNSSCSGMSDITEPTIFSKSGSFRRSRSMYIVHQEASLLGINDDALGEKAQDNDFPNHNFFEKQVSKHAPVIQERTTSVLPNINETKPFNAISSEDILAPHIVNGFLNRIEDSEKADEAWDVMSTLSNDEWHVSSADVIEDINRQRVFSDSDVVFEFQRQRMEENEQAFLDTPHVFDAISTGSFGEEQLHDHEKVDIFLDSDECSQMVSNSPLKIATELMRLAFAEDFATDNECSPNLTRSRFFSDSECTIVVNHPDGSRSTTSHQSTEGLFDEFQLDSLNRRPRFLSDSSILVQNAVASREKSGLRSSVHSTAANTFKKWSRRNSNSRSPPKIPQDGPEESTKPNRPSQQLSSISTATALSAARMMATNNRSQAYYWNLSSESETSSPHKDEVLWMPDDDYSYDDIL